MKKVALELDEWLIETDLEQEEVTRFYCKELRKMKGMSGAAAKDKGRGGKVQIINDEDFEEDDDEDELENAFLDNAMNGKKDSKRVDKILKSVTNVDDKEDFLVDDGIEDTEETKAEVRELEKIIEEKHSNFSKISRHYKLFEYVSRADPEQVLRYVKQRGSGVEPLWMSEKNQPQSIPNCPLCGSKRLFEFQIMPQIFDQLQELMLVDWNTVCFYTC
jgi:hypothetical protein